MNTTEKIIGYKSSIDMTITCDQRDRIEDWLQVTNKLIDDSDDVDARVKLFGWFCGAIKFLDRAGAEIKPYRKRFRVMLECFPEFVDTSDFTDNQMIGVVKMLNYAKIKAKVRISEKLIYEIGDII